ncbi:GNAT family N-acetyltransferase [Micromonospora sp. NPDC049048]|uniref:GNAT family N-acetyltransferase n=1 Tax=Micromonospora sp. NPDC049048 TaxID=3364263 RepID=UPI003718559E
MSITVPTAQAWNVAPALVGSTAATDLLRDYYTEVSNRYHQLHLGRPSTPHEIEEGLAATPSDDLAPPTGLLLLARHGDDPAGCVGLRILDPYTAELTRMFVRPALRGLGGGARLLVAAERFARDLGAERIVLDTRLDLVEARALYVRHGYVEIPAYHDGTYAEIFYERRLSSSSNKK